MSESKVSTGGIGFIGVLFLLFLAFKLSGIINWSWWWITAPLWGSVVLVLLFALLGWIVVRNIID